MVSPALQGSDFLCGLEHDKEEDIDDDEEYDYQDDYENFLNGRYGDEDDWPQIKFQRQISTLYLHWPAFAALCLCVIERDQ